MPTPKKNDRDDELIVLAPTDELRGPALELVLASLPVGERTSLAAQARAAPATGEHALEGLFAACRRQRLVGAVWGRVEPGRTARVWPPQTANGEADAAGPLWHALVEFLRFRRVRIAHSLLPSDSGNETQQLGQAGFCHATDVLFLVSLPASFPSAPPAGHLDFVPFIPEHEPRLRLLVEATYTGSLDCPALNGVRDRGDVLAGYRATGEFDPSRWLFVEHQGRDVGCLLLSDHAASDQWELVYMGLTPAARGNGWGLEIVRHAQWLARRAGRSRLVLAVDAANAPAVAVYAAAGFTAWDQRSLFLKVFDD
jgi:ribosomal protein S18 acetylase RimI-like enzyme